MIDTSIRSLAVESNFSALRKNQEEPLFRLEPGRWGSNDFSVVWSFGGNYSVCVPLSSLRKRNEKETVAVSREKNRGGKEKETNERSGGVERNRWKGGEREREVAKNELESITSARMTAPRTTATSPPLVITVRRFTAGRLLYSRIHVDGRIHRGHSTTEFPRQPWNDDDDDDDGHSNLQFALGVAAARSFYRPR